MATQTLRKGHLAASGIEVEKPASPLRASSTLETYYAKHEGLRDLPASVIRKAWFTMAHLLIAPGSLAVDMGANPMMTYAMAVMNPQINYVGVNLDKKLIKEAQKTWQAPNLEFREGDINTHAGFEEGSVDAIINSFVLHTIFSNHKYSERAVIRTLENHFKLLRQDGLMFIRDYSMPPEEYVLLEMPDKPSKGSSPADLSEADLLVWYSEHARPRKDGTSSGFFLEELPQRFPKTRLFRLLYKWAYEFIMRKDDREHWDTELPQEYTFFTPREYRKNLRALGARVLYTAPQWDDSIIRDRFENSFRLYGDDGKPLPVPPTSFVALAQNRGEKKSLRLHEARPSNTAETKLRITAMRNEVNGDIFDIISRDIDLVEVIPYRVTETGELNVFIHDGLPRGIANAVPRTGKTIDGKRWSGHMTEAISVPGNTVREAEDNGEQKAVVLFARDQLGLKPAMGCLLEKAPPFFPAPDFIDEQIQTRYLRVMEHEGRIAPKNLSHDVAGFSAKGHIREVSAQSLINAVSVGYIPNARLEMQILHLFEQLGLKAETWNECPLALDECIPDNLLDGKKFSAALAGKDSRFKNVKGTAGNFRTVKSIFVDEGWVDGGLEGLAVRDIEFAIADGQTVNKAIILPLTKHAKTGQTMLGMMTEYLPVPQRHGGNGLTLKAPSITLPKEVASIDQAKRFIGEQFGVGPERVARLGESYFCHIGVTPIRVFPFCVATTGNKQCPMGGPVEYAPLKYIGKLIGMVLDWNQSRYIVERFRKVYHNMGAETSEVTGDWHRSVGALYDKIIQETPTPIAVSSPLAGFSSMKKPVSAGGSGSVAQRKESAPASYITSPDFADIRHERDKTPPAPAQPQKQAVTHDAKNNQKSKGE